MTYPHGGAAGIWRDGAPSVHKPRKSEIRDWGNEVENRISGVEAVVSGTGKYTRNTLAALNAVSGVAAGETAYVLFDGANAGTYEYNGSAWQKIADLPPGLSDGGASVQAQFRRAGVIEPSISAAGDVWTGTIPAEFDSFTLQIGQKFLLKAPVANAGPVTLDLGTGGYEVVAANGQSLEADELESGIWYAARFSGSSGSEKFYLTSPIDLMSVPTIKAQARLARWVWTFPNRYNRNAANTFHISFSSEGSGSAAIFNVSWRTLRMLSGSTSVWKVSDVDVVSLAQFQCLYIDTDETYNSTSGCTVHTGDLSALEQQFVIGNYVLLLGNYYGIPIGELAAQIVVSDLQKIADETEDQRAFRQFATGDDGLALAESDGSGAAFLEVDAYGNVDVKSRQIGTGGFADAEDGAAAFEATRSGDVVMEVDQFGAAVSPATRLFPMPFELNGSLCVGEAGAVAAPLRAGESVLNAVPFSAKSVRAIVNRAGLSANTAASASAGVGVLVPDDSRVIHIIILNGQSLSVGAQADDSLVTVWSEYPDDALMFGGDDTIDIRMGLPTLAGELQALNPATLTGFQPLIAKAGQGGGSRGETVGEGLSRHLVQKARSIGVQHRTLWIAPGLGGTAYDGLKRGTQPYANMVAAVARAKALAEAQGWRVVVDAQIIVHGEADSSNTGYYNDLLEWQLQANEDLKAETGQVADIPFLMQQPSSFWGSTTGTEAVKAMLRAHEESDQHFLLGPSYQAGDLYAGDILHFTGPGYRVLGETGGPAVENVLWGARDWQPLRITSAVRSGSTVTLTYSVPNGPLVIDTSTVSERDDKGFRYFDGSGEIAISSVSVSDQGNDGIGSIQLTLGTVPSGTGEHVDYALNGHSGSRATSGIPRGNIRDSAGDVRKSIYDGRRLDNWAVHQTKEVTVQ